MSRADPDAKTLEGLATRLGELALARKAMLAAAESCTGGLVAGAITSVAGSSAWFERGFVTYSNQAKVEQLGVDPAIIERHGAVSEQTVLAMAAGALAASTADWAVAVTGIAGPGGGSADKPVGTVWFAWAGAGSTARATSLLRRLPGGRTSVRLAAVQVALQGLVDRLS